MSLMVTLIGYSIMLGFLVYLHYYIFKKRMGIKMKNMSLFEKDRRSAFIVIEIILIALFIAWFIVARSVFPDSKWAFSMSGFVFFFLIYLFRGIEAYAENKTDRSYYYHWSASGILLLMFLWTLTVEFILF